MASRKIMCARRVPGTTGGGLQYLSGRAMAHDPNGRNRSTINATAPETG